MGTFLIYPVLALHPFPTTQQQAPQPATPARLPLFDRKWTWGTTDPFWPLRELYGDPDERVRTSEGEIYRYTFLAAFHDHVEFELKDSWSPHIPRINWPLPVSSHEGQGIPGYGNASPALPRRHSMAFGNADPRVWTISIPLDSLSGVLQVGAQVFQLLDDTHERALAASYGDHNVHSSTGTVQTLFLLKPAQYVCEVTVTETATGRRFTEDISFSSK